MEGYLGEEVIENTYSKEEMALKYITMYGGTDGGHHKAWVIDQVARILNNAPVTVSLAKWQNGHTEERYDVGTCEQYQTWVYDSCYGEDGPFTWAYDEGIAP